MAYIVIIDDDEDFANAAAMALTQGGHEVAVELSADRALDVIAKRQPELIILDVMFPESPSAGFDLARTLRQDHKELANVPMLMLTAVNEQLPLGFSSHDIDETWMPVSGFLEKPVDFGVLQTKVEEMLAGGA